MFNSENLWTLCTTLNCKLCFLFKQILYSVRLKVCTMGLERKLQSSKEWKHQRVFPSTVSARHGERQRMRSDQDTTVRNNVLWFLFWAIFPRKASQLKLTTKEPRGFSLGPGPKNLCKDQAGGEGLEHHFYCHIGPFSISLDHTAAVMLLGTTYMV